VLWNRQALSGVPLWFVLGAGCAQSERIDDPSPAASGDDGDEQLEPDPEQDPDEEASTGEADHDEDAFPTRAPDDPDSVYDCFFVETFDGPTGAPWPEPWVELGGVGEAELRGGWGRLRPALSEYSLARMGAPLGCQDFDATVSVIFTDPDSQGAAIYGRQNGGYLRETSPYGRGYSVFAEAFREPTGVGLWRELGGTEQDLTPVTEFEILPNVEYKMRLRVKQLNLLETQLQGKLWEADKPEPLDWSIETIDTEDSFQKAQGSVALDVWSNLVEGEATQTYDVYFDNLVVTQALPEPGEEGPAFTN
jgi:hypothetical protein